MLGDLLRDWFNKAIDHMSKMSDSRTKEAMAEAAADYIFVSNCEIMKAPQSGCKKKFGHKMKCTSCKKRKLMHTASESEESPEEIMPLL